MQTGLVAVQFECKKKQIMNFERFGQFQSFCDMASLLVGKNAKNVFSKMSNYLFKISLIEC